MFNIKKSKDGCYFFVLKAKNGETIATSEMYEDLAMCKKGIRSVKSNAPKSKIEIEKELPF